MYNVSKTLISILQSFQVKRMLTTVPQHYDRIMLNIESNDCLEKNEDIRKYTLNTSLYKIDENTFKLYSQTDIETLQYPWLPKAKIILKEIFKKDDFLPSQLDAIQAIMKKKDCLIIKSTGGGKSLCYQLPSLLIKGFCIVITPLISLVDDQIIKLNKLGIPCIAINKNMIIEERKKLLDDLMNDKINYKLIYITPEQYAYSRKIKKILRTNCDNGKLSFIAIDEIHCLKDWGETFRGSYNSLKNLKKRIKCPVIGLTATATNEYIEYFQKHLILKNPVIIRSTIMRHNLTYQSILKEKDSLTQIYDIIKSSFSDQSGIIYCLSRKESEKLASYLIKKGIKASFYHGRMCNNEKDNTLKDWLEGKIKIIVGTNAFGMGIDKENVRFIIHHTMPLRIFDYIQETGRAGRDGLPATCIVLFDIYDIVRRIKLNIDKPNADKDILEIINFFYSKKCKKKIIADIFDETFNENICRKNCKYCNKSIEEDYCYSEKLLNSIFEDAKMILHTSKQNITQKKLSASLQKLRPHWNQKEMDMLLTNLILKGKLKFNPQKISGTKQTYIQSYES
ncbi:ATP-dependent DNA helicase Q1 [Strongyloides ratti]|uniref:DNA 3'-5' helicase n=1 Tax=Strongyloides ratti TaxID=34506 RepID=A0A090LQL9_STRRB|nr:ATP-dependent DNA helicase Q1 [Strongyloides ratti]CEF70476.1 ATP-dependent DNA helicase Q1 [Strongyloides ratti]